MPASSFNTRLAGEDLRDHHHVCALVDGPDDAFAALLPFVLDGFARGDRAFHIVDPRLQDAHIERLRAAGIDTSAAMASHQLEVRTWTDSYLRGGKFDRSAQIAYVRESIGEGPALGFPVTRLIGSTEWAVDAETVRDLLVYERRVDEVLPRLPGVAICTYDLNRHSPRTITDALGVHAVALVGGSLRTSRGGARDSARERLLSAASRLFHENGVRATGIDALIAEADVAKATFYRHFPSKDDLVVAWLRDPRSRWLDRVRAQAEADAGEPADVVPLLFDAVADWLEDDDYRGSPYMNSLVEITEPTHPARVVILEAVQEVEDYLAGLLLAAGYRNPRQLAAQLQTLVAGSITLSVSRRNGSQVRIAREAAVTLLAAADRD